MRFERKTARRAEVHRAVDCTVVDTPSRSRNVSVAGPILTLHHFSINFPSLGYAGRQTIAPWSSRRARMLNAELVTEPIGLRAMSRPDNSAQATWATGQFVGASLVNGHRWRPAGRERHAAQKTRPADSQDSRE